MGLSIKMLTQQIIPHVLFFLKLFEVWFYNDDNMETDYMSML